MILNHFNCHRHLNPVLAFVNNFKKDTLIPMPYMEFKGNTMEVDLVITRIHKHIKREERMRMTFFNPLKLKHDISLPSQTSSII